MQQLYYLRNFWNVNNRYIIIYDVVISEQFAENEADNM